MTSQEMQLIQEALQLVDDAVQKFSEMSGNPVAIILAKLAHGVISTGEMLIGDHFNA